MRIIAGSLKGRVFHDPPGHRAHPMSEKVRGALFNALGDIEGLRVLDAFAGSGALSFEAASRSAGSVVAIEKDRPVHNVIVRNTEELKLKDVVHVIKANAGGWSMHNMEKKFDIVLLDPPYDYLQFEVMKILAKRHIKERGILVLSYPGNAEIPKFDNLEIVLAKEYGDSQLIFYRRGKS